ncbi:MAG: hypothetical protein MJZ90_07560 [Bacteroidales bacterium]|nr:hypothetical protein [Bacteroidales bacterium]
MRKNILHIVASTFMAALLFGLSMTSCKKDPNPTPTPAPDPIITIVDSIPASILPREIYGEVSSRINIHSGNTPPDISGQYLSQPHALLYESYNQSYDPDDSTVFYSDRYVAFTFSEATGMDFYGKQWDTDNGRWIEEHVSKMKITGEGDNFCCFYVNEGYPNGIYLKQSTIFSGTLTPEGLKDFKVAVIMVENDGDEEFYEKNSFRILGDFDGMAENNNWMGKKALVTPHGQADSFLK